MSNELASPHPHVAADAEFSFAVRSLAKHLRSIPAAASERRALYGLDSTHLAQLVRVIISSRTQSQGVVSLF